MSLSTDQILEKAAMVTADLSSGGLLNPAQANRFIDMVLDATVLSRDARQERMNSPKQWFEKIGFDSRIMRPAVEAEDPGEEDKPATDRVELSTVEGIAIVQLSYSTLEDNIERGRLADHVVRLIAERVGLDLEEQWLNGDEENGPDAFLEQNNGVLALATSHTFDEGDMDEEEDVVEAVDRAFRNLPKKYIRNKREWRAYVHYDAELQLRQQLAERATGAGDRFLLDDAPVLVRGIPVVALPSLETRDAADSEREKSDLLLVHPRNIMIGVQRQIQIESDRLIRKRVVEYVTTIRSDVEFEEEDAVSKGEIVHAS